MAIKLFPVTPEFAAEVGDVDLTQPLSPDDRAAIKAAFWKYGVLIFPAQSLTPEQHIEFAQLFGPLEPNINSYQDDVKQERIDGLVVEHSIFHSRAKLGFTDYSERERAALPPAQQVLVRTIPETGRRSLYIASHARRVIGMPDEEARGLLDSLMAHATQRQFVYTHRWRLHDLVMWDNRCTMHRGTEFEEQRWKRDMQRATVSDIGNTCELMDRRAATSAV